MHKSWWSVQKSQCVRNSPRLPYLQSILAPPTNEPSSPVINEVCPSKTTISVNEVGEVTLHEHKCLVIMFILAL